MRLARGKVEESALLVLRSLRGRLELPLEAAERHIRLIGKQRGGRDQIATIDMRRGGHTLQVPWPALE